MAGGQIDKHYINRDFSSLGGLKAEDLPFDAVKNIKQKIEEITTGAGLTGAQHESLDSLAHILTEDCFTEIIRQNNRVSNVIIWVNNTKTIKIRETNYIYTTGRVTQIVEQQYNGAGELKVTQTTNITRTAGKVSETETTVVYV